MKARLILVRSLLGAAALQLAGHVPAAGQAPAPDANISGCAPQKRGEGARWLAVCQRAAESGDGQAALITGMIYWNGDGVAKDNTAAARWWKLADEAGRTEAAKLLGDEAFVRITAAAGGNPLRADRFAIDEAIGWYRKALEVERNPAARAEAEDRLKQAENLKRLLPPASG